MLATLAASCGDADGGGTGATGGSGIGGNDEAGSISDCPANTSFCAGFEYTGAVPTGAAYLPQEQAAEWERYMTVDILVKRSGQHSLMVKSDSSAPSESPIRLLLVPVPASTFWVRLYLASDREVGQPNHNTFLQAMTDSNDAISSSVQVSEQHCQVVLNMKDDVVPSMEGSANSCSDGTGVRLTSDVWHCVEAFFDGPNGVARVLANGTPVVEKTDWPALDFNGFAFGFVNNNGPSRNVWYDDVAISTERIGCP